jgi:hypothetical protein
VNGLSSTFLVYSVVNGSEEEKREKPQCRSARTTRRIERWKGKNCSAQPGTETGASSEGRSRKVGKG